MKSLRYRTLGVLVAAALCGSFVWVSAQGARVAIDPDDIGGVVTSSKGPEAGVWVIAETTETPTRMARMVVTDDQGRYVLPDLPRATFQVWVRGYGLVDSARVSAKPGQQLNLQAVIAPNPLAAAQVYPGAWWMTMLDTRPVKGTEMSPQQAADAANGCYLCHQMGNKYTREIPAAATARTKTSLEAWDFRTHAGPSGPGMGSAFLRQGVQRQMWADWSDRIAKGESPKQVPPRPKGIERNLVVTVWFWGVELAGRVDNAASDTRNPNVNANGLIYGALQPTEFLAVLDPRENRSFTIPIPSKAPKIGQSASSPSLVWGGGDIWERQADPRSVAMDHKGRVWVTGMVHGPEQQPSWCAAQPNKFGKNYPIKVSGGRQMFLYDPSSKGWGEIDTCFHSDHNLISEDNFIYLGSPNVLGWIDMNTWDKTRNSEASTGWCPGVVDTNGDGKITEWTEPDQPVDPKKDVRINFGCYSLGINEQDGSVWCAGTGNTQRSVTRIVRGSNPPETCRAETYAAPPTGNGATIYKSGGVEVDHDGVVWLNWRGSAHFTAFDRRKCKPGAGRDPSGAGCPEGWTSYRSPATPKYDQTAFPEAVADQSYLTHLDHWDTLGLGKGVPMYANTNTDSLEAILPKTGEWVTLRIPYPMGYFARHANGRIDDPKGGWKGKGWWSAYSSYAGWHTEGGKGTKQPLAKFQFRPNPLAK